jgi:hypothetical protein
MAAAAPRRACAIDAGWKRRLRATKTFGVGIAPAVLMASRVMKNYLEINKNDVLWSCFRHRRRLFGENRTFRPTPWPRVLNAADDLL